MNDLQTTLSKLIVKICNDFPDKSTAPVKELNKDNIFNESDPADKGPSNRDIDKLFVAHQGVMVKDWTQTNVVISIIQRDKEYGFVIFEGTKLATDRFIDLFPGEVFPIDKTFRCELGKGPNSVNDTSKAVIPLRVTCRNLGLENIQAIKFQIDSHDGALNLNAAIKRILEKLPEAPPPEPEQPAKNKKKAQKIAQFTNEFPWLRKYDTLAKEHVRKRNINYDDNNLSTVDMDEVEEYMMMFTDPGSFQSVMATPPTMAAMMLTSLVIANPLKNKFARSNKSKRNFNRAFLPTDFSKKKLGDSRLNGADVALSWLGAVEHSRTAAMDSTNYFIRRKLVEREREYCKCVSHTIFVGTWNVNAVAVHIPEIDLKHWFDTQSVGMSPDFYVLGLQDICSDDNVEKASKVEELWLKQIESAPQFKNHGYVRLFRSRMSSITIVIYIKKELFNYINTQDIMSGNVVVGQFNTGLPFTNLWAKSDNKGAVAVRLALFHTSVCFICCHLSFGEMCDNRNEDFNTIMNKLVFNAKSGQNLMVKDHDVVFMFGTMNYRIIIDSETVKDYIDNEDYEKLSSFDELNRERLSKRSFPDFNEGDLDFYPTYKYVVGSDDFDYSQVPFYADRILWSGARCDELFYRSNEHFNQGEHKPVAALFNVGFRKIDGRLLHKTYEAVSRNIDMLYNISMPKGSVDSHDAKLGKVTFMEPKTAYITLKNIGISPFMFDFNAEIVSEDTIPKWLTIEPTWDELEPDQEVKIKFEVTFDADNIAEFIQNGGKLNAILVLCLLGGKHMFINVVGDFQPTSFGLPLAVLHGLEKPAAKYKMDELLKMIESHKSGKKINPPKKTDTTVSQITRLVDHIGADNGLNQKDLFRTPGQRHEIHAIIEVLDTTPQTTEIPNVGVHSVVEVLMVFLHCLPDPVICNAQTAKCLEVAGDYQESKKVINSLPILHKNLFHYIIAFLKACLGCRAHNGVDIDLLSHMFSEIMIDDMNPNSEAEKEKKALFIKQFIETS